MRDARWIEIELDFEDACEHFSGAVKLFEAGGFDKPGMDGYTVKMAFMHAMQSGHTSLETGLLRILDLFDEMRPHGEFWHKDLLNRACMDVGDRIAILSPEICDKADETRRFRNLAVRSYNNFQIGPAKPATDAARILSERLTGYLRDFRMRMDPPEDDGNGDGSGGGMSGGPG